MGPVRVRVAAVAVAVVQCSKYGINEKRKQQVNKQQGTVQSTTTDFTFYYFTRYFHIQVPPVDLLSLLNAG